MENILIVIWFPEDSLEKAGFEGRDELEDPINEALEAAKIGEVSGGGGGNLGSNIDVTVFQEEDLDLAIQTILQTLNDEKAPQSTVLSVHNNGKFQYNMYGFQIGTRFALSKTLAYSWKYDLFVHAKGKYFKNGMVMENIVEAYALSVKDSTLKFHGHFVAADLGTAYFDFFLESNSVNRKISAEEAADVFEMLKLELEKDRITLDGDFVPDKIENSE